MVLDHLVSKLGLNQEHQMLGIQTIFQKSSSALTDGYDLK
jgi:hypothetical protein